MHYRYHFGIFETNQFGKKELNRRDAEVDSQSYTH